MSFVDEKVLHKLNPGPCGIIYNTYITLRSIGKLDRKERENIIFVARSFNLTREVACMLKAFRDKSLSPKIYIRDKRRITLS
jgi:hypothetical protein